MVKRSEIGSRVDGITVERNDISIIGHAAPFAISGPTLRSPQGFGSSSIKSRAFFFSLSFPTMPRMDGRTGRWQTLLEVTRSPALVVHYLPGNRW